MKDKAHLNIKCQHKITIEIAMIYQEHLRHKRDNQILIATKIIYQGTRKTIQIKKIKNKILNKNRINFKR